jgi:NADH-quinone oxidoreductase subunit L
LVLGVLWIPAVNEAAARLVRGEIVPTAALELALGLAALVIAAALVVTLRRRARLVHGVVPAVVSNAAADWFGIGDASRRMVVAPTLATSRALAEFDDRVIDAGIRASGRIASGFSRLLRRRSELSIDALVNAIGGGMLLMATGSRVADDHGVDHTAEGLARGLGRAGDLLRRLPTGLSHHYYVVVAVGLVALVAALAVGTS